MQRMTILLAGALAIFGASVATAAPTDYLEKIRCLAAFEAAAATLEPDSNDPNANARNRSPRGDPPEVVALRERIDQVGEQLGREVDSANGLSDSDREEGDRAFEAEAERLYSMLENARDRQTWIGFFRHSRAKSTGALLSPEDEAPPLRRTLPGCKF
jgi:hypothetical protein